MALPKLFKVKRYRYYDADGNRCSKSKPGAVRASKPDESDEWYADIRPTESARQRIERRKAGLAAPKRERVKLCKDKRAAQEMLRSIIEQRDKQAAGLKDFHSYANQTLGPMVEEFESHLKAKGNSAQYVETTLARLQRVFSECNFLRLVDLECSAVEQWLYQMRNAKPETQRQKIRGKAKTYQQIADRFGVSVKTVTYWRQKGAPIIPRSENDLAAIATWHTEFTKPANIGTTTSDHYVTVLKRFGNWLVKPGRKADANPFNDLDKLNDTADVRKQRRVLPEDQFALLIAAAANSDRTFRGLSGVDRAMIYTLAAYTGLRASEIGSLLTTSFAFGESPMVTVEAAYTKNSKLAEIPLRLDLADRLSGYFQQRPRPTLSFSQAPELVWPGTWTDDGADMIRIDLEAAGIPYSDDDKDYDFHALRHQFITGLARAGVSLKAAQELARHSKPELTANVYTHLSIKDTAADVERLNPIPTGDVPQRQKATGTDGQIEPRRPLGKHWGKQEMKTQGILSDIGENDVFGQGTEKACETLSFAGLIEGG